jgi:hypothetical protein
MRKVLLVLLGAVAIVALASLLHGAGSLDVRPPALATAREGPCGLADAAAFGLVCEWEAPVTAEEYAALGTAQSVATAQPFGFSTPQQCCCRRASDGSGRGRPVVCVRV